MPTLLLTPRYTDDSIAILIAAQSVGWATLRLYGWRVPPGEIDPQEEIVFYGEPLLAATLAEALPVALLEPPLDWLPSLPAEYRKRDVRLTTLGEARAITTPAFIKPADDKCFAARVYSSGAELPQETPLPDETPTLVAEPVDWRVEYRCFVLERTVATLSPYWRAGALAQTEDGAWPTPDDERTEMLSFVETLLADRRVKLPSAVALDVGIIVERGWAVVEANAAWGSGLYGCDPLATLPVLQRACVRRATLASEDAQWVVARA